MMKSHSRMIFVLHAVSCAAAVVASASPGAAKAQATAFESRFGVPALGYDEAGLTSVEISGCSPLRAPGAPALPTRHVRLALPPDADPSTVRVSVEPLEVRVLPGTHDVRPAPPARRMDDGRALWGASRKRIQDGRDTAIYGSDAAFPSAWGEASGGPNWIRGFLTVDVVLNPVRYLPSRGVLEAAGSLEIRVTFETGRSAGEGALPCRSDDALAKSLIANFSEAAPWYLTRCVVTRASSDDGIAVITTEAIADESLLLEAWKEMRESQDHTVIVATEEDWDISTGDETEDGRADRIRKWLVDNRASLDLGWVLLIGNPDPSEGAVHGVPMKLCAQYASDDDVEIGPTDFYYADLTSDFDANGNGVPCEMGDNVAFVPDVYVGRLPVYSDGAVAADEMLARILDYEAETLEGDLEWRRRMMLPNSIYFYKGEGGDTTMPRWDGATVGQWFIHNELEPRGLDWTALYEREGYQPSQFESHFAIDSQNVVDQWARGYGFVYWTGHGSEAGVYRTIWTDDANGNEICDYESEYASPEFMTQTYTGMLVDAPPPFVVHGSCSNATPEVSENLAYNMLRRGAIATLAATRVAMTWHFPDAEPEVWEKPEVIDGDVSDMTVDYTQRVLGGAEAGRALGEMIAVTTNANGDYSLYQKSIQNLYGDPLMRLVMCRSGAECDDGSFCNGVELCDLGTCKVGTPIACGPTAECDDMVCDDAAAACIPGPTCVVDAGGDSDSSDSDTEIDTGTETDSDVDSDSEPSPIVGITAGSGCAAAPIARPRRDGFLGALL